MPTNLFQSSFRNAHSQHLIEKRSARTPVFALAMMLGLAAATTSRAATGNDNWIGGVGDNNWSSAGNWTGANTPPAAGDTLLFGLQGAGGLTLNNNLTLDTSFYGLTFNASAPAFTLGGNEIVSTNTIADNSPNLETVNLPIVFPVTNNVTAASGASMVLGGVISGAGGLTANGLGTVTLTNANTYTGATAVNAGILNLNFSTGGISSNIIANTSALKFGGGALNVVGASASSAQTNNGATFNAGGSAISANGSATLALGAMTEVLGGSVVFNGPATATYTGGSTLTSNGVAATATIMTTTVGTGTLGLIQNVSTGTAANLGAYATVGLYDWASTDVAAGTAGASPYTIIGGSQVTGFYNAATFADNMDVPAAGFALASGTQYGQTLRFNTPSATANTPTIVSNPHADNVQCSGILVTPNMGAQNAGISGVTWSPYYGTTTAKVNAMQVWQNNTLGYFLFSAGFYNGRSGASINSLVQNGPGTVIYAAGNTQTGPTYLNGGYSVAVADSTFGTPATAAAIYLNGGTIVATNSFTLDNAAVNKRPINLLANGGGLAAAAGSTLTVDGQIGSASGTGPLVIGIPASTANGNVAGLLPGSGTGTANTTPVYGTGTVVLNYANNTAGNYQFGGTIITGGATLNINSEYDLGGADQGPTIFNGGTLQYNSTLALGTAGTVLDISVQPVTFAGNATIDFNGQTVTYANSIGNGSSGSLTVANSGSSGVGGLYLNGGSTHTGGTIVAAGAVLGSTGTLAGNVTWTTNSYASLSVSSPMTVSGSVTLTNTTVNVVASGLTTGVYPLLTATGGITSGSTVNSSPGGTGIVASGYAGTISISGNSVILTVVQLGVAATWTDGNADQNWSEGGNWTGGTAPHSAGDAATLGSGGVGLPVTLNVNETVGGIAFNNASSYTIIGANTLTLDNTTHGIPIAVTAGISNAINTAVALNGNVSAAVGTGDSLAIGGIVANQSTPETLTVTGGGTLALTNANTYGPASSGTVGTTLNGATLQLGNNISLGAGDVNVTANSTLQPLATGLNIANNIAVASSHTITANNNGGAVTLSGVISGNGNVAAAGSGSVILSGVNNTYTGSTVISSGVLSIAADGASAGNSASLGVVPATATANNIIFTGGDLLASDDTDFERQPRHRHRAGFRRGLECRVD
jgi:fibronectin-binding autotransporter adhesin